MGEYGEYENAYPDAHGRREEVVPPSRFRHFLHFGRSRQVRDSESAAVSIQQPEQAPRRVPPQHYIERPRPPLVERTPREICDDVYQELNASPFIDASGISITVDDTAAVMLEGTINSLIAIALAKALTSGIAGVSRVEVRLRVQPTARSYDIDGSPVYKIAAPD